MATFPMSKNGTIVASRSERRPDRHTPKYGQVCQIAGETYFLRMLCSERKRAERSGRPFMLMVISGDGRFTDTASAHVIPRIQHAVSSSIRETDTLGWYESGNKLAILFTEIGCSGANTDLIVHKVTAALQHALDTQDFQSLQLSFRLFPQSQSTKGEDRDQGDLMFYPDILGRHHSYRGAHLLKRTLDILGSLLLLVILCPALLVIALLVKVTSPGPIVFRQTRMGQYGKTFTFLKFRSMCRDSDPQIHQEYVRRLIEGKENVKQNNGCGSLVYKLTDDPRVTPVGRFLRKTSLDELPQLLNVFFGDMALVGPRPPVPYEFERYSPWHRRRILEVKPGITGLWQVMGRSKTTFDDMVRLDLRYARVWTVWMDLKILWRTPLAVIRAEGAY